MPENVSGPGRKYIGIDHAGTQALYQKGGISEFAGFPESLRDRLNVALKFTTESETLLRERVIEPLLLIGNGLGIEFILAGRDFPYHSTLLEGLYEGKDPTKRQQKFKAATNTEEIKRLKDLAGMRIAYKYLLIDKGNLLLTAIDIPDWVINTRSGLAVVYQNHGLKPLPLENILHISVARITRLPTEDRSVKLREYKIKVSQLRHQISPNPIVLEVGHVSVMPSLDLLTSKP